MEIRMADVNDIGSIAALYRELYHSSAALQPEYWRDAKANKAFIRSIIEGEDSDVLIAVSGDQTLGFALLQQERTSPYECVVPHKYAFLMDLCVHEPLRGQGIGTALLESVRLWAKNRKLDYVELNVLAENDDAKKLYEQHNYRTVIERMRLPLKKNGLDKQ